MDYGLAMKSDHGLLVTKQLARLLRLNLMFKQKNAYSRSMFMQVADAIRADVGRKERASSGNYKLSKRQLCQTKVTSFMTATIKAMQAGTYRVYTGEPTGTTKFISCE